MMDRSCIFLFLVLVIAVETARISRPRVKTDRSRSPRILRPKGEAVEDLFNVYDPSFLAVVWPKISNGVHLFLQPACWRDVSTYFKDLADGRGWAYRGDDGYQLRATMMTPILNTSEGSLEHYYYQRQVTARNEVEICISFYKLDSAVDASGRYEAGLFKGNTYWLGSKEECLQLDHRFLTKDANETVDEFHNGDYLNAVLRREKYFDGGAESWRSLVQRDELMRRLVVADNSPPYRTAYTAVQLSLNLTKVTMAEAYSVTLGVCLPRSCSPDDVTSIITFSIMINDNLKSNKTVPRTVKLTSLRQIEEHYDITNDIGALLLISVTLLLFIIAVIATAVDLKIIKCRTHNSKSMSFDLQKFNNNLEERTHEDKSHVCDILTKKESNVLGTETLTINNINNSNNINLVTVKKVMKPNAVPPSITLDVVSMERVTGSCKRCGKYKKQCNANNPRHSDNLPACPRVKSFASITTEHKIKDNPFKSLLLCFSLTYSWRRIFNTNMANKDLAIVHILKILATFWVIFVHVGMIANYASDNGGDINEHNNAYYILLTGTLAFDTLFFVSGLFSAHHYFFLRSQYSVEELVSFGGVCGQVLQFVCFVTNRAIRLLPSYAYVVFLSAVIGRCGRATSPVSLPGGDHHTCDTYWWRNLLYVTTLFPRGDQCMQISWYMSVESQLHLFGALCCAVSGRGRRLAAAAGAAALLVAVGADVCAAYSDFGYFVSSVYGLYAVVIERPLARVAPYLTGLFAGWLVMRLEGVLDLNKKRTAFLWSISIICLLSSVGVSWCSAWLSALSHAVWPLALLWPAIAAATSLVGYTGCLLNSRLVAALSRLSYGMLLLHVPLSRALLLATDSVLCADTVCIWWYFAGTSLLTVLASLLLSLLVETPCCSLLRRLSDYAS